MCELGELDLSGITAAEERQILDRLLRGDFDQWAEQAARVGRILCNRNVVGNLDHRNHPA